MRTFTVTRPIHSAYISVGVEYTLNVLADTGHSYRNHAEVFCGYMSLSKFKACLRDGSIVFTDIQF